MHTATWTIKIGIRTQINTFCSQSCKLIGLSVNMENIEHGRPIEFIRHRRESQGYAKVKNEDQLGWRISN